MKQQLKWSHYNFLLETDENYKFLYNAYTNNLLKLNDELFEVLQNAEKLHNINDLEKTLSKAEKEYFTNNFILIGNEEDIVEKLQFQEYARVFSKNAISLTIAPTQKCNFNCSYCFENFRDSDYMSDETEKAIIDYLQKQKEENGLKKITLYWYGGEPLLAIERVKSLSNKIKLSGIDILYHSIITNGYLFTEKNIHILEDIGINAVQITLDGTKETHDKRRPLVSGGGTFDKIIDNLDNYFKKENNNSFQIHIRVNVDKTNSADYVKIFDWLKARYPQKNLIVYPGWVHIESDNQKSACCLNTNDKQEFCIELAKSRGIVVENLFPKNTVSTCTVQYPYTMLIAPDGSIYKCWEELGDKEKIVGNINLPIVWTNHDLRVKYAIGVSRFQDSKCRKCRYLPICNGGCPLRRYENKYEGKNKDCCTYFKGRLKDYLELHYKMKISKLAE